MCASVRRGCTLAALILFGTTVCPAPAASAPKSRPRRAAKPASRPAKPAPRRDEPALWTRLTPLPSGPGLQVCEPAGATGGLAQFGAGCGRWLHLMAAGQPELGRTPLWITSAVVARQFRQSNLSFPPETAVPLGRLVGATHVATGEISEAGQSITLTYTLRAVADGKTVGEPLALTGTREQIAAGLPGMARQLAQGLGVKDPTLPAAVAETPAELELIGAMPWLPDESWKQETLQRLRAMGQESRGGTAEAPGRTALASFLFMLHQGEMGAVSTCQLACASLLPILPRNPLFLAEAARTAWACRYRYDQIVSADRLPTDRVREGLAAQPRCYLLHTADLYLKRMSPDLTAARQASEMAVRCSATSSEAWLILGSTISLQSDGIRRARTADAMSEAEWKRLIPLYGEELAASLKAVLLNEGSARAWETLSSAATFAGEQELAETALWKGLAIDPADRALLKWGLQMYQPKWFNNRVKLEQVARMTLEAARGWEFQDRLSAALAMHFGGLKEQPRQLLRTDEERARFAERLGGHQ